MIWRTDLDQVGVLIVHQRELQRAVAVPRQLHDAEAVMGGGWVMYTSSYLTSKQATDIRHSATSKAHL